MTNTNSLAALVFPGQLDKFVMTARARGESWRTIAANVNAAFDGKMSVTHETLRQWYGGVAA